MKATKVASGTADIVIKLYSKNIALLLFWMPVRCFVILRSLSKDATATATTTPENNNLIG